MLEMVTNDGDVRKFGVEVGLPTDIGIEFKANVFEGITIWSECVPTGAQHLEPEDIIDELKKLNKNIKKHISAILLSPSDHPKGNKNFASLCDLPGYIIIYSRPIKREILRLYLRSRGTLYHEGGHIMDVNLGSDGANFSHRAEWSEAQLHDSEVRRSSPKYLGYWIFGSAETYLQEYGEKWALQEDFADSIRYYLCNKSWKRCFKKNYPNRYEIVKKLLE